MTFNAQLSGHSVVWTGSLELPDPKRVARDAAPLGVTVEPLPE